MQQLWRTFVCIWAFENTSTTTAAVSATPEMPTSAAAQAPLVINSTTDWFAMTHSARGAHFRVWAGSMVDYVVLSPAAFNALFRILASERAVAFIGDALWTGDRARGHLLAWYQRITTGTAPRGATAWLYASLGPIDDGHARTLTLAALERKLLAIQATHRVLTAYNEARDSSASRDWFALSTIERMGVFLKARGELALFVNVTRDIVDGINAIQQRYSSTSPKLSSMPNHQCNDVDDDGSDDNDLKEGEISEDRNTTDGVSSPDSDSSSDSVQCEERQPADPITATHSSRPDINADDCVDAARMATDSSPQATLPTESPTSVTEALFADASAFEPTLLTALNQVRHDALLASSASTDLSTSSASPRTDNCVPTAALDNAQVDSTPRTSPQCEEQQEQEKPRLGPDLHAVVRVFQSQVEFMTLMLAQVREERAMETYERAQFLKLLALEQQTRKRERDEIEQLVQHLRKRVTSRQSAADSLFLHELGRASS